jgi:palmitoyl transferase
MLLSGHKAHWVRTLFSIVLLCCTQAFAQETQQRDAALWDTAKSTFSRIAQDGQWDGYFSGYAKHFAKPADGRINNHLWGGGLGKTLRNAKGNDESLFAIITQDSNWHKQYLLGYSHQWIKPLGGTTLEVGGGYALLMIRRMDVASGTPFPFILPVASIGTKKAKLMATLAPYNGGRSRSAVAAVFAKYTFD